MGLPKVFFEGVVAEFQAFFGSVGPQVAVHAPVARITVFVEAGAPGCSSKAHPSRFDFRSRPVPAFVRRRLLCRLQMRVTALARQGPAPIIATRVIVQIPPVVGCTSNESKTSVLFCSLQRKPKWVANSA